MDWNDLQLVEYCPPEGLSLLSDTFGFEPLSAVLLEADKSTGKPRRIKLRGKFGRADEATANKRIYGLKLMEREINKAQDRISAKKMFGELGHPKDGKTEFDRISHMVEDVKIHPDGLIEGTLILIPGTRNGDTALAIANVGGQLGVSSRGFGTTIPDAKGFQVVQEDYQLVTWDIVADPASSGAYPNMVIEEKEKFMDIDKIKKEHPELFESIRNSVRAELDVESREHARVVLKEEFATQLSESAEAVKEKALEEATAKLLSDPEVAGAREAMRVVKDAIKPYILREDENSLLEEAEQKVEAAENRVAKLDEEVAQLKEKNDELSDMMKESYFKLYIEQKLSSDSDRVRIEEMLGEVKDFESLEVLVERVEKIKNSLNEDNELHNEASERIKSLEAKNRLLEEKVNKMAEGAEKFALKAYIEKSISGHPRVRDLRRHLSEAKSKNSIDKLIQKFNENHPPSEEYNQIRQGLDLNKQISEGRTRKTTVKSGFSIAGVDLDELSKIKIQ